MDGELNGEEHCLHRHCHVGHLDIGHSLILCRHPEHEDGDPHERGHTLRRLLLGRQLPMDIGPRGRLVWRFHIPYSDVRDSHDGNPWPFLQGNGAHRIALPYD